MNVSKILQVIFIHDESLQVNKSLRHDLLIIGLWNEKMKNSIIANNGSAQNILSIPLQLREKYKIFGT